MDLWYPLIRASLGKAICTVVGRGASLSWLQVQNLPHAHDDSDTLASLAARIGQPPDEVDVWQTIASSSAGASLHDQPADYERHKRLGYLMKVLREQSDKSTVKADHSADRDLALSARHMRDGVWTHFLSLSDATMSSSRAV